MQQQQREPEALPASPYYSVDPAPPSALNTSQLSLAAVSELGRRLVDTGLPLFERYRAMFALRNVAGDETRFTPELSDCALPALSDALNAPDSALFRHEVAYVLGACLRYRIHNTVGALGNSNSLMHNLRFWSN